METPPHTVVPLSAYRDKQGQRESDAFNFGIKQTPGEVYGDTQCRADNTSVEDIQHMAADREDD